MALTPGPTFDVHGRFVVEVVRTGERWTAFYVGQGLKRPAEDIRLPPDADESALADHLDVLFHEYAAPGRSVRRIR